MGASTRVSSMGFPFTGRSEGASVDIGASKAGCATEVGGCSIDGFSLEVCASTAFMDKSGVLKSVEREIRVVRIDNIHYCDFADVVGD